MTVFSDFQLMLLVVTLCCATIQSATLKSNEELVERAAAQLERLTPFRKTGSLEELQFDDLRAEVERTRRSQEHHRTSLDSLYELEPDDPTHERIKRTGGLLSGVANKILGKVASASSGLSSGVASGLSSVSSSGKGYAAHSEEYGPPVHNYDDKSFDVWAFKKAILNTLFQALKAIGGGVIALKGQLIKGGGYLISTKGRIISAKGEAITSLGRHIASSAVLSPSTHGQTHDGYSYEAPHVEATGHSEYEGPPPSAHGYSSSGSADSYHEHGSYGASSDDGVQAGLLILKPIESEHKHHHEDLDPRHPNVAAIEESFGSPLQKGHGGTSNLLSIVADASSSKGQSSHRHEDHQNYFPEHKDEPAINYGPPPPPPLPSHVEEKENIIGAPSLPSIHQAQQFDPHSVAFQQSILDRPNVQLTPLDLPGAQTLPNYHGTPNLQSFGTVQVEPLKIPILSQPPTFYGQPPQTSSLGTTGYGVGLKRKDSVVNLKNIEVLPAIGFTIEDTRNHRIQTV